jgi:hypothetical protein
MQRAWGGPLNEARPPSAVHGPAIAARGRCRARSLSGLGRRWAGGRLSQGAVSVLTIVILCLFGTITDLGLCTLGWVTLVAGLFIGCIVLGGTVGPAPGGVACTLVREGVPFEAMLVGLLRAAALVRSFRWWRRLRRCRLAG